MRSRLQALPRQSLVCGKEEDQRPNKHGQGLCRAAEHHDANDREHYPGAKAQP